MKYAIVGVGSRGMTYGTLAKELGIEIAAIAELRPDRLKYAADLLEVPEQMRFGTAEALFAQGKIADAVIIATMDRDHFHHLQLAMDCGYDILLEKPITPDPEECIKLKDLTWRYGHNITVCHVLRYTSFWGKIKELLDSGELGRIVAIKHSENIGLFHMAHSFVRGNWRNDQVASPIIMQKCCHDLDMLLWLTGKNCRKVAAFGGLNQFWIGNLPEGAAERCLDCGIADSCKFDARKCYLPVLGQWPADVVCTEQTEEALLDALKSGPYGRCVYRCDNQACDHLSVIMDFTDGVTATFSMTAQTSACHRHIHIMCEKGELEADDATQQIKVTKHVSNQAEPFEQKIYNVRSPGGHGGGDYGLIKDFTASLQEHRSTRSAISRSFESHLMACAIEHSRRTGSLVDLKEYEEAHTQW